MRKAQLVFLLTCVCFGFSYSQNKANQAPSQQTFSLQPDNIGALQNSVNLINGQVSFPMELASLPGRGGLNIATQIFYNSGGIDRKVNRTNLFSPTGILGIGWSMDIPQIVCDHKQTGTRMDDAFYFVENGVSNELTCVNYRTPPRTFVTKMFKAWKIDYYPSDEKWIITKEDGFKYTFQAVQFMVKWGNWIGDSGNTQNQSRLAYTWALTEIENFWGDKLQFQYTPVEEAVSSCGTCGGLTHTKAFYLSKIIDPIGQSVEFVYSEKEAAEFQDPHTEQIEPDAYQEKYETKFLSNLIVRSSANATLHSIDFGYQLLGDGTLRKRYLTSIQKRYPSGAVGLPMRFEYFQSSDTKGYLKNVLSATGARVNYYYKNFSSSNAADTRNLNFTIPTGYGQPKMYVGQDYVVATFRQLNGTAIDGGVRPVKVYVFQWNGRWNQQQLWELTGISNADYEDSDIALAEDNFIYRLWQSSQNQHVIRAAHKNGYATNGEVGWVTSQFSQPRTGGDHPNLSGGVYAGKDFVAFINRASNEFQTLTWREDIWHFENISVGDPAQQYFVTATNNYIFIHNDGEGNYDRLHLYYLDGEKKWQHKQLSNALAFSSDGENRYDNYWYGANSFVFGLTQYNPEYIYTWDENYDNFQRIDVIGKLQDNAQVYTSSQGQIGISETGSRNGFSVRYDGTSWKLKRFYYDHYLETSYGDDYAIFSGISGGTLYSWLLLYNANTSTWENQIPLTQLVNTRISPAEKNSIHAGVGVFQVNDRLYQRQPYGWISYAETPLQSNQLIFGQTGAHATPDYLTYVYRNTGSNVQPQGYYVVQLQDGELKRSDVFATPLYPKPKLEIGPGILAYCAENNPQITMSRVVDQQMSGTPSTVIADYTSWTDGTSLLKTQYIYEGARPDLTGVPLFNRVTVVPGGSSSSKPYGSTQFCFYNGMSEADMLVQPLASPSSFGQYRKGLSYQTSTFNKDGQLVSEVKYAYDVSSNTVKNSFDVGLAKSYLVQNRLVQQTTDGVKTELENVFLPETGQIGSVIRRKQISQVTGEVESKSYKYYWQVYDPSRSSNLLSPVIQEKVAVSRFGNITGNFAATTATKWSFNGDISKYIPLSTYINKTTSVADFTAWLDQNEVSSDWIRTDQVNQIDLNDGSVIESEQQNGTVSVRLYDATHTKVLASAMYAKLSEVAFTSFDDASAGNWVFNNTMITSSEGATGPNSFLSQKLNGSDPDYQYISKNLPAGTYQVTYWSKSGTSVVEAVNGTVVESVTGKVRSGWTYYQSKVSITATTGTIRLKVPTGGKVDDVVLKPVGSVMATFVYDQQGNVIANTDNTGSRQTFQYDGQSRLTNVRDDDGNIIKQYIYHYRNQ